jgi:hypothetical protein
MVFDHVAISHRKLLDMTIVFSPTREKVFIVTGDRDCIDVVMDPAVVLDDYLFFEVCLFLTPVIIRQKKIIIVAGL